MPFPLFPEIRFRIAGLFPPIRTLFTLSEPVTATPPALNSPPLPKAAVPAALVPMKLPSTCTLEAKILIASLPKR